MTPLYENKLVKVSIHHKADANQIDVDGNMGYDMRRTVAEVIAELTAEQWTIIPLLISPGMGHLNLYCSRRKPEITT